VSGGRHRRSDDDTGQINALTGSPPAGAARNGAVRNGAARAATGQNGAVRAAAGQNGAVRGATGQNGAVRGATGQNGAVRNGAARPAAGETGATRAAAAAQPTTAYPTAAALNAAARAARSRAARGTTTETQAPRTSIPTPRHPATGELMAPDEDLFLDEPLTMPFGIEPVRVPPAQDLFATPVHPDTDHPADPETAEDPAPEPKPTPASTPTPAPTPAPKPAPSRTRHTVPGSIASLSWPRRLLIALVVLALLGGALWMAAVRPTGHVPPAPAPLPATPGPVAPPSAGPSTPPSPPSTAPTPPPTGPVNLAGWKLTIPEASDKGTAANVNPAASKSPWLTRGDGGSIKFWAPVDGATTPNSQHPRTELDSLTNFKAGTSPHTLNATLVVSQAPSTNQDIIIGQIHGADDISSVPFVMLHYDAGTIKVVVKEAQSGSTSDKYPLITGVPLGARFSYTISDLGNGNLVFSASYGASNRSITTAIPQPFRGATVRFQAGAYQQGESSSGATDGARITFYTLRERATPGT